MKEELRLKRLYDGPGYDRPGSSLYRGYGSFFLPKLHEKGIIKLDDQIYNNLKEGQHHWGGAVCTTHLIQLESGENILVTRYLKS